jgi:K+ transporter
MSGVWGHLTSLRERIQTDESVPALARELFAAQAEEYAQLHSQASRLSGGLRAALVKSTSRPGMARWRERLYSGLARIATRPTDFFRIPPDRVIDLGAEVEI